MIHPVFGIDDLPDEIVLQIFDRSDVPTATLLNIALSSKRLHYLCLPLFLSRFEITDPVEHTEFVLRCPQDTPGSLDALTGLKVALFIPSVKHLICRLNLPGDVEDVLYAATHMRRVHEFISTLSSIETVTLHFGSKRCGCCSELDPGMTLDGDLAEWSNAIGLVLSMILERSCRTLSVVGGKFMVHSYTLETGSKARLTSPWRLLNRKVKFAKLSSAYDWINILQGDSWEYKRASDTGKAIILTPITRSAKATSLLNTLVIQSTMFAMPPVLHWTISVLRLPTTKTLHLRSLTLSRMAWFIFFTLIAENCPHLVYLKLTRLRNINAFYILRLLKNFSHLESLYISYTVESYDSPKLGPFPKFTHLKTLVAPATWVSKLLSAQSNATPSLQTITIFYNLRNDDLFDWLDASAQPNSIPAMLKALFRPSLSVHLKVALGRNPGWALLEDYNRYDANNPPEQLSCVVGLTISIDQKPMSTEMALSIGLPQWIGLFYELRFLELKTTKLVSTEVAELASYTMKRAKLSALRRFVVNGEEMMSRESR